MYMILTYPFLLISWNFQYRIKSYIFWYFVDVQLNPRVLLTHIPLYRQDWTSCGPHRGSPVINQVLFCHIWSKKSQWNLLFTNSYCSVVDKTYVGLFPINPYLKHIIDIYRYTRVYCFVPSFIPITLPLKLESIYHTIQACYIINSNEFYIEL